ncbi:MAG: helix-turn-helix domain-containing protein [Planctomycetota bacterium]|jgi:transcriptional regulator with XRE-family HTH domain
MSIGTAILRARQERGMTQGQVGKRAGLATSYISRIENDRIQPTMPTLSRVAKALGVPVSTLFRAEEKGHALLEHRCPVSGSGQCIGEQIRSHQGPRPTGKKANYGKEELRLLKMADYIAVHGTKETRRALAVVLESLIARAGKRG